MRDRRENSLWPGLVLGVLIGAGVVYYLTSTDEGKKVKEKLKKKGEDALGGLGEIISELEEKGEEFKKKAKQIQDKLEEEAKDVKEGVAEEAQKKLDYIEELCRRGRRVTKRSFTRNGKNLA